MSFILRGRLGLLLGALMVITASVGFTGWWYVQRLSDQLVSLYKDNLAAASHLSNAERGMWELRFGLPNYVLADIESRAQIEAQAPAQIARVQDGIKAFAALSTSQEEQALLREFNDQLSAYLTARPKYFALVAAGKLDEAKEYRAKETNPHAARAVAKLAQLIEVQRQIGQRTEQRAMQDAVTGSRVMLALVILAMGLGGFLATSLASHVASRVGSALKGVQSSSRELEGTATQQASSAQQLASATAEISVTIRELLATSRQISDAAKNVSNLADQTGDSARDGDAMVKRAQAALAAMKQRVDEIVTHMLHLGNKSQQIGGILEIVNELTEQTNILSINATIEAAGAGEAGQRFAVVADEIRRLADRVGNSAREIRTLVDEVRAAANTTVMATEDGSKAVALGTDQFGEVLRTFQEISHRVEETTTAARQIELSTQQQTGAVEQVNSAMSEVVRSARDTESGSQHLLKTCEQLAHISRQLASLAADPSRGLPTAEPA